MAMQESAAWPQINRQLNWMPILDEFSGESSGVPSSNDADRIDQRPAERPEMARAVAATLFVNVIAVLAILTAGYATFTAIGA